MWSSSVKYDWLAPFTLAQVGQDRQYRYGGDGEIDAIFKFRERSQALLFTAGWARQALELAEGACSCRNGNDPIRPSKRGQNLFMKTEKRERTWIRFLFRSVAPLCGYGVDAPLQQRCVLPPRSRPVQHQVGT